MQGTEEVIVQAVQASTEAVSKTASEFDESESLDEDEPLLEDEEVKSAGVSQKSQPQ